MQQWNKIFKEKGKFFFSPHVDIDYVLNIFNQHNVEKLLDLGCGSGRHVVYFAKQGFQVYGLDIAEEGIKITKDWLKNEGLEAHLTRGSIYNKLPYSDNYFDAIISTQVIHHGAIEDIRKTISEMERVLKPCGIIFITVAQNKYNAGGTKFKIISPRTYVPLDGKEIGLPHYIYNRKLLKQDFKHFTIYKIWVDPKKHYCLVGESKKSI